VVWTANLLDDNQPLNSPPFLIARNIPKTMPIGGSQSPSIEGVVMRTLRTRQTECRGEGLPGIPRRELLRYLEDVAEQLDWLHRHRKAQHLDVKPEGIGISESGSAKLGTATLPAEGGEWVWEQFDFSLPRENRFPTGALTPAYAAPEVFGGRTTPHCDQYSLAIVYQELLTSARPFRSSNLFEIIAQHTGAEPDLSRLPAEDRAVIGRALSGQADRRFQCCVDLLRAFPDNPWRQAAIPPTWLNSSVSNIARAIDRKEAFDRLPILADALEEAGCTESAMLAHCHSDGPHVRGCWVVDLILGKK
jgi:serine/threonine protein kinase